MVVAAVTVLEDDPAFDAGSCALDDSGHSEVLFGAILRSRGRGGVGGGGVWKDRGGGGLG